MRIALLAPLVAPIAPPYLGGAQALLYDLAAGLAARGHAVTLYAAPGSDVPGVQVRTVAVGTARLRPARFAGQDARDDGGAAEDSAPAAEEAFGRAYTLIAAHAGEHDLLHAHAYDRPAYALAAHQPLPVLHTLHLPALDPGIRDILGEIAPPGGDMGRASARLVAVSRACAATYASSCAIAVVIYNGIPIERIPFGAASESYLLYAGRISPEKGVADALDIAARAGRRLVLAGGVYDEAYSQREVAPRVAAMGARADYLGPLPRAQLWELMAGAAAVLCPIQWDEPFGLVACEAQAAGAPVVGYARGALPEVVAHGRTGWLVPPGDVAAAARAAIQVGALARTTCRAHVAARFGLGAMLADYEAFYAEMLAAP